jgi:chitinase
MTDMLLAGFPVEGKTRNVFPALRQHQVAIGLPANPNAGNGFTSVAEVHQRYDCLTKDNYGSYKPRGLYPNLCSRSADRPRFPRRESTPAGSRR